MHHLPTVLDVVFQAHYISLFMPKLMHFIHDFSDSNKPNDMLHNKYLALVQYNVM